MDQAQSIFRTKRLLSVSPNEKTEKWLKLLFRELETCPLEIPEVIITHTNGIHPYIHAKLPEKPSNNTIELKRDVGTGLLDFGCGLAIHLPNSGEPTIRLRYGDLVWLAMNGTIGNQKNTENPPWGVPSTKKEDINPDLPNSGKLAEGTSTLEKIPTTILKENVQKAIREFIKKSTGRQMNIGLMTDQITKVRSLVVVTGIPVGGAFNPVPLLQALCWHCPAQYTWTATAKHVDEDQL